jgi:hypothetical protein
MSDWRSLRRVSIYVLVRMRRAASGIKDVGGPFWMPRKAERE